MDLVESLEKTENYNSFPLFHSFSSNAMGWVGSNKMENELITAAKLAFHMLPPHLTADIMYLLTFNVID